jgi:glycosyltransferase involved in cell wall biosynthesis
VFPFNYAGWLIEKVQLWVTAKLYSGRSITICDSSKRELENIGFRDTSVIAVGADTEPLDTLPPLESKYRDFTVTYFGSQRSMKRPEIPLRAFAAFNKKYPDSRMVVAGMPDKENTPKLQRMAADFGVKNRVLFTGKVSLAEKKEIMRKSHLTLVASVKEGWGMIVTEANSQGTPSVTYDVAGLRDSNSEGFITANNTYVSMAEEIERAYTDKELYATVRKRSWEKSKHYSFDQSYKDFKEVLEKL